MSDSNGHGNVERYHAYQRAFGRALRALKGRYPNVFADLLHTELEAEGWTPRKQVSVCEVCGDPERCMGRCQNCYNYERRTGERRSPELIAAYRERKA